MCEPYRSRLLVVALPFQPWFSAAVAMGVHGHAGFRTHLSESRANWAKGNSDPERFIVAGDQIIAFVHVRVRRKDSTE